MHGLILVTWEKFLADNFGSSLLQSYRTSLAETPATSPLASRVYEDELLLAGVNVASQLTGAPVPTLLRGYGRYFITNGRPAISAPTCSRACTADVICC